MVAPNGARRTKTDHPGLPLAPEELAAEARDCLEAGAAAIHLHVRDGEGRHSLEPADYLPAIAAVREAAPDMVVQITTEAVGRYGPAEQMACVRAVVPEAASLALRELAPDDEGATLERLRGFLRWMQVMDISPQFILYAPEEVERFLRLRAQGVIAFEKPFLLFVLGRHSDEGGSAPEDLDPFVEALGSATAEWAVCAFGPREAEIALHAARLGGHARIGFENNDRLPDGSLAGSNADLVRAVCTLLEREGYAVMEPRAARALFRAAAKRSPTS